MKLDRPVRRIARGLVLHPAYAYQAPRAGHRQATYSTRRTHILPFRRAVVGFGHVAIPTEGGDPPAWNVVIDELLVPRFGGVVIAQNVIMAQQMRW